MAKLDDALLDRLSAYVDGELSAAEMNEVENLMVQDPAIAQTIDALRAANRAVRNDFLKTVKERKIPEAWLQLIKEKSPK